MPGALSGIVLGFRGFDSFRPRPRARVAVRPNFTSHQSGNHFVAPADFATIYNLNPLYAAGLRWNRSEDRGGGANSDSTPDIDAFRSAAGLRRRNLQLVPIDSSTGFNSGDEVESDLDVEWAGGSGQKRDHPLCLRRRQFAPRTCSMRWNLQSTIILRRSSVPAMAIAKRTCTGFTQPCSRTCSRRTCKARRSQPPRAMPAPRTAKRRRATTATQGLAVDAPASVPEVTAIGGSEFTGDASTTPDWNGPEHRRSRKSALLGGHDRRH